MRLILAVVAVLVLQLMSKGIDAAVYALEPTHTLCGNGLREARPMVGGSLANPARFYRGVAGSPDVVGAPSLSVLNQLASGFPGTVSTHSAVDPNNPLRVVLAGASALAVSTDGALTWQTVSALSQPETEPPLLREFLELPQDALWVSGNGSVVSRGQYYSLNGGLSFHAAPLGTYRVHGIGNLLYALNLNSGYRSNDGGNTWSPMQRKGFIGSINADWHFDAVDPAVIYYGSQNSVGKWFGISRDGGDNWTTISHYLYPSPEYFENVKPQVDRTVSGLIYELRKTLSRVSFDYGLTWSSLTTSFVPRCTSDRTFIGSHFVDAADHHLYFYEFSGSYDELPGVHIVRLTAGVELAITAQLSGVPMTGVSFCANPNGKAIACATSATGYDCIVPWGFAGTIHPWHANAYFKAAIVPRVTSSQSLAFSSDRTYDGQCLLDVNRNGIIEPEIDGVAILQKMLGFGVSKNLRDASVCAHPSAWTDIDNLSMFNATGAPGGPSATTDGLLITRVMRGLRGTAATSGAIPLTGATRTTWAGANQLQEWFSNTCRYNLN